MEIIINESKIIAAAASGMDAFVELFGESIEQAIGGEISVENMPLLNADQITLLAYLTVRREVMNGGFIQLIYNGYGPFIFLNPFAKAMRQWGAVKFQKLIYKGRKLFERHEKALTRELSDDEFMALFEQFPEFDDLDDEFITMEEELTELVAHYIDAHIDNFATVQQS